MKKYFYNLENYNFQELLADIFKVEDLTSIHENEKYAAKDGLSGLGKDTHSFYHKLFYSKLNNGWPEFENQYNQFIKKEVMPIFANEEYLIYQKKPSFRIQYPKAKAVTTIHCDSDSNHRHPLGELNIILPITEMKDTSALWVESLPNLGDFKKINLNPGEWILWNGNRCRHFNKENTTEKTRVSLDFRILPVNCYNTEYAFKTATTNQRFVIGEYYSKMER